MKKLISLALVLLMTLGCIGTSFAAEVSSEGLTVDGWNGWTVKSGTAVTTQTNPLAGDTVSRGTVVKVTNGSAERYFAQWFEGVIELSVDVYGTGTISFVDSNNRSAGTLTLADASINSVVCSYNASKWNTVKLFVATGTKETEVYLGNTYVTTLSLEKLVRPSKLVVSSANNIYVDNIKVSELMKTAAYEDGELNNIYTSNFATDGTKGWNVNGPIAAATTFDGSSVISLTKTSGTGGNHRFRKTLTTEGNFVFEFELLQDATNPQTSGLTVFARYQDYANTEGGSFYLLSFGKDGYIDLGSDFVPSETFKTEPLYKLGEWFKVRVEVLTENQSMILYVANLNSNGEYGEWVRVNDIPVEFRFNTSAATNKEVHTAFEELVLNLHSRTDGEALWYLKSAKISELADSKTETVLFEDFNDNTMNVNHVNLINVHDENDSYADYLLLTPMKDVGDKTLTTENGDASVKGKGQLFRTGKYNSASTTPYYDETVPFDITSFENYTTNKISHTQTRPTMPVIGEYTIVEPEYWKGDVDLSDAEKVTVSFDFYDAGIARHPTSLANARDTLKIGFGKTEQGVKPTDQMLDSVYFQNGSAKSLNSGNSAASYTKRVWDKASLTFSPYTDSSTKNISLFLEGTNRTITWLNSAVTGESLKDLNELKFFVSKVNGGRFYLDNLKVTKEVPIGVGYIKKSYSAYNTFTDIITRGNVTDIALKYVDFETADGKASGIPTAGGTVKSIAIEENATVKAGTKLVVGVFEGETLSDSATIPVVDGTTTYPVGKTLTTTATSVVKVFIWDMSTLVPLTTAEQINDGTPRTKLVLLGDSIVCDYDENGELRGWGQMLGGFVNTNKLEIVNHAISGASTADYLKTEGMVADRSAAYEEAIGLLDTGDYLMISLTTNDSDDNRNIPLSVFSANIQKMIDDAEEKGATPILVTTHPRCKYVTANVNRFLIGDAYMEFIKEMERVAELNKIPLIDLYEMAIDSYDTGNINSETGFDDTIRAGYVKADQTHLNETGATFAASLVAKGMAQLNCGIEDFVK